MQTKAEALTMLRDELQQWQALIDRTPVDHRATPTQMTLKESLIHLWAWQQHTIAYFVAARAGREPEMPPWPVVITPDDEGDVDATNAWIAQTYYDKSWAAAHHDWQTGFQTLLTLAEALPEADLLDGAKYPWRGGWPLLASLEGTYEHHHEHRDLFASA
ncbi:MAG: ClbS/DfsB family four-helix bundle protein [Ktedonobacterales bacterium]|nr:ClbS/DfsB family four-helix bundle protein [Ktedonobacterales bacterium]